MAHLVRIGLLGFGTVGQAVASLVRPFGVTQFEVTKALVRDLDRPRPMPLPLTTRPQDILDDPSIDVVVEVIGGREPARTWIAQALSRGKAVVTANKEVMAYHGPDLLALAQQHNTFLGYEASVGGGIPVLDALRYHLTTANVKTVAGVLNGTSNYLLWAMSRGQEYQEALREAQRLGYAESDPRADVEGLDAARKLVLLVFLAFGRWLDVDRLPVRGIAPWPPELWTRLQRQDLVLRLVALARETPDHEIEAQVSPVLLPTRHPWSQLEGAQNGIFVDTSAGSFWLEGPGAGGLATATSIWADIRRSLARPQPEPVRPLHPTIAVPATLPTLAISRDPDRTLSETRYHLLPTDPSMGYCLRPFEPEDGVEYFPVWDGGFASASTE
ncbi:MAG: homoserine dehydrogenase [Firmicutes bacterium]|nr:homoserine dehydrogenase [Bacillota bacterium]